MFTAPEYLAITEAIAAEAITESVMVYRGIGDPEITELVLSFAEEIPHAGSTFVIESFDDSDLDLIPSSGLAASVWVGRPRLWGETRLPGNSRPVPARAVSLAKRLDLKAGSGGRWASVKDAVDAQRAEE